ncbi:MAG: DUF1343 domain-containing protein [Candidatus Sumerlaeia bacterium]
MNRFLATLWLLFAFVRAADASEVVPGVEVLAEEHAGELAGKRVGILTNPTGVGRDGITSTIDIVRGLPGANVVRLFAPEHGVRGGFQAGENVDVQTKDPISGLPVVSLHGAARRPAPGALDGLDVVLYDIQDVGVRHYTFISTLACLMEACEAAGVELWVLDRPDPLGGDKVGGPVLDEGLRSFIGVHTIPLTYGLTPGEFARLYRRERTPRLKLTVIPMRGWRRGMMYGDLGWPWIPPSEHIPRWETCVFYAMTGELGELRLVSEGVGTPLPFEQVGAPWIDSVRLAGELNALGLKGVTFRPTVFRPRYGTFAGEFCNGVQIHLADARQCDPALVGDAVMATLARLYPEHNLFAKRDGETWRMFRQAVGDDAVIQALAEGNLEKVRELTDSGRRDYLARRKEALIYNHRPNHRKRMSLLPWRWFSRS